MMYSHRPVTTEMIDHVSSPQLRRWIKWDEQRGGDAQIFTPEARAVMQALIEKRGD